ncbi:hypothetical protein [Pseudomonas costantinii]|uniref:hypothetical protein n=1 Tax=Pseudomonas costantinii TaxID=168469 RepID=UPI0015A3DBBE|nr:hypothetical protein [Pseudomonas costantinii]NVZ70540.1 hypothetical protein [Pseudomonas costantinii]
MNKDWVVWCGCVGLFLAGGIYFNMLPSLVWKKEVGVADVVGGCSAIAAAVAAFAAWRAASIANKQSTDSALSIRWQMYKMHQDGFNEWLKGIEADQGVTFYRKNDLYEVMFPFNRDPSQTFSDKGSAEVAAWGRSFESLADRACTPKFLGARDLEMWVFDYANTIGYMRYYLLPVKDMQFFLDNRLPTGINVDNYEKVLPVMSMVIERLSKFAFVDFTGGYRGMTNEFKESLMDFYFEVSINNYNQHSYREDH